MHFVRRRSSDLKGNRLASRVASTNPYNGQRSPDNAQTKKERRGLDRASTLSRTAERSAGLGDTCFRVAVLFDAVFALRGQPIALTKPAAQVNEPATLTAERKARRVSRVA